MVRWASPVVGGVLGARVAVPAHRWWTAGRVLALVGSATVGLALVRAQHCRVYGWGSPGQFVHACYSDVAVLHATVAGSPAAILGQDPALPDGAAQPALAVALLALLALVSSLLEPVASVFATAPAADAAVLDAGPRVFFDLYAVVAAGLAAVLVLAVVVAARSRPWDAALVAFSPVLVFAGLVDVDLLAVALGAAAATAWLRGHPVVAGLLLGLAVATRFHVVLLGVALVILALRTGERRRTLLSLGTALATWAVVNAPLALAAPTAWSAPIRAWWRAEPGYGSVLQVPFLLVAEGVPYIGGLSARSSAVVVVVLTLVVVVATAAWVLTARTVPPLAAVVLVLLVGSLLVAKAVPVQASLWLLPWAALAVPQWRCHAWWWAAEGLYFLAVWQYLVSTSDTSRALPAGWFVVFVLARLVAIGALGWWALRSPVPRAALSRYP